MAITLVTWLVYLDFAKAFDKVDHGVLRHKIKIIGITEKFGVCFYHPFCFKEGLALTVMCHASENE